jgi:hypothetical protein
MATPQRSYVLFFMLSMLIWLFAGSEIFQRAKIDLNGKVISSETSCVQPLNNRCATEYVVEAASGDRKTYIAGPTDKALRQLLPVGTVVVKEKWSLSYAVNGVQINDFPFFYKGMLLLGFGLALLGYVLGKRGA